MSDETKHVLGDAFAATRPDLEPRLRDRATVEDARRVLRDTLGRLADDSAAAAADPIEAERLRLAAEMVRGAVLGALSAVRKPESPQPHRQERREPERRGGLSGAVSGWLGSDRPEPEPEPWRPPPEPLVDVAALLEQAAAAYEAADRLLAAAEPPPPERVRVPWEDDEDLMDLVHDLLAAHYEGDAELAMRRIARLEQHLLLVHDIRAVPFDEETRRHFVYVESADRADPRVIITRPALKKAERVVRRGEVRGPVRTAATATEAVAPEITNQEGPA